MPPPIKLLVVGSSHGEGGAQRVISALLEHIDRARFEPSLFLFRNVVDYELPDDIGVTAVLPGHSPPVGELARRRPHVVLSVISALRRHIVASAPDAILSSIDQVSCVTGTALRLSRSRARWVARVGYAPEGERRLQRIWSKWVYPRADAIVVNAHELETGFVRAYPASQGRVHSVANPTDFDAIDRKAAQRPAKIHDASCPLLIAVGRLTRQKRPDLMLDAVARIAKTTPVRFWFCGKGPLESELRRGIRSRGLEGTVELLGFCDNPYALMKQADLFVMASDFEGLPNALIEAQGLGIPAVATDCLYGPSEIVVDGKTGLLVPTGDAAAIADAISSLLTGDARRAALSAQARVHCRAKFGVARLVNAWEQVLTP